VLVSHRFLCKFFYSITEDKVPAQVSVAAVFQTSIMQVPGILDRTPTILPSWFVVFTTPSQILKYNIDYVTTVIYQTNIVT
jgi:hypothetical protein